MQKPDNDDYLNGFVFFFFILIFFVFLHIDN